MWAWVRYFNPDSVANLLDSNDDDGDHDDHDGDNLHYDSTFFSSNRRRLLYHEQASHTVAIGSRVYAVSNLDFRFFDRDKLHNFHQCSKE
jgi:hypothetical protein